MQQSYGILRKGAEDARQGNAVGKEVREQSELDEDQMREESSESF